MSSPKNTDRTPDRTRKAAEAMAARERADRNRRLGIIGATVVALAAVLAALIWLSIGDKQPTVSADKVPAKVAGPALVIGPDDAATKVVVHEDFLCPFCRELEMTSRDFLHADAIAGKVQVEYRPFQLLGDDYSQHALLVWGGVMATGTPEQALAFHDALYDDQPAEASTSKPSLDDLLAQAAKVGADQAKVKAWITSKGQAWFASVQQEASDDKVTSTPTVTVDGKQLQGASIADMADNLQRTINQKK